MLIVVCRITSLLASAFVKNDEAIAVAENRLGRFVLAINELDSQRLKDEEMLTEYKSLSQNESSFKFIKDTRFCIDSIFLKASSCIEALMMMMTLCLMVYNVGQHKLLTILEIKQETVPNQVKKPLKIQSFNGYLGS